MPESPSPAARRTLTADVRLLLGGPSARHRARPAERAHEEAVRGADRALTQVHWKTSVNCLPGAPTGTLTSGPKAYDRSRLGSRAESRRRLIVMNNLKRFTVCKLAVTSGRESATRRVPTGRPKAPSCAVFDVARRTTRQERLPVAGAAFLVRDQPPVRWATGQSLPAPRARRGERPAAAIRANRVVLCRNATPDGSETRRCEAPTGVDGAGIDR